MEYKDFSDESLALLEHITYIDSNVLEAADIRDSNNKVLDILPLEEGASIGEVLEVFDDDAIAKLREFGDDPVPGALISGNEWADIIENLKGNEELKNLEVFYSEKDSSESVNLNICYKDRETGQGVITYKGTTGYEEWYDNCIGFTEQDTKEQQAALAFYNKCVDKAENGELGSITLTGHSKGGNKAMYVTVVADDDRISKCVSFDGQGFSNEFYDEYAELADENGGKIKNYFVSKDFVHALLKQIPHSQQISCAGYGMDDAAQYHSPNSFFVTDKDGKIQSTNGIPEFEHEDEDENIKLLNKFVVYAMNNYPEEDLEKLGQYLGEVTGQFIGAEDKLAGAGALFDEESILTLGSIFYGFSKKYDLSRDDFDDFMQTFAVNDEQAENVDNICEYVHNAQDSILGLDSAVSAIQEDGIWGIPDAVSGLNEYVSNAADISYDLVGDGIGFSVGKVGDGFEAVGEFFGGPAEDIGAGISDFIHWGGDLVNDGFDYFGDIQNGSFDAEEVVDRVSDISHTFGAGMAAGLSGGFGGTVLASPITEKIDIQNPNKSGDYAPIENIHDYYLHQEGKSLIKPEPEQAVGMPRRAVAR